MGCLCPALASCEPAVLVGRCVGLGLRHAPMTHEARAGLTVAGRVHGDTTYVSWLANMADVFGEPEIK